jgi:hypothetical protein
MKKNLFLFTAAVLIVLGIGCKKQDAEVNVNSSTPIGTWIGNGQYGSGAGSPTYPFTLTFKTNGIVEITGNNGVAADNATGTWQVVGDKVISTYRYSGSSADYTLSGGFSQSNRIMIGTIGLGTVTTGVGSFSVTRQ